MINMAYFQVLFNGDKEINTNKAAITVVYISILEKVIILLRGFWCLSLVAAVSTITVYCKIQFSMDFNLSQTVRTGKIFSPLEVQSHGC